MDDPFIRTYIDDVLRSLRTQWILELIKSYTRVEIAYLSRVGHPHTQCYHTCPVVSMLNGGFHSN